jgi:2-polyprenyl-3-methyl-5-hydroxy-6-metoxy-1,4-benzoquinol methylase
MFNMDAQHLNQESQAIWDANAEFWDNYMGEGGSFQRVLIGPATERLLNLRPGERVLDMACGNGAFARRLAQLGARMVASDFSAKFIERAKARTTEHRDRIEYRQVDATDEAQLLALGVGQFDAAVCAMALMDMPVIAPLMNALRQLLKPGGRFVFSTMHPCFNSNNPVRVLEEADVAGDIRQTPFVKIGYYLTPQTYKGLGVIGQPAPQYYFHRSLTELLGAAFRAGWVIDALEEPAFPQAEGARRPLSWEHFREIPPVLIVRLRLTARIG